MKGFEYHKNISKRKEKRIWILEKKLIRKKKHPMS